MSERKHIKVKSIGETRSVGKTTVSTFQGEDGIAYEFWGDTFKQYIVIGAEIEADIDYSEKQSGNMTYKHWKVAEIYLDGKPVRGAQKPQGWQPRGDNPEQRASIEKQVCLKSACEIATAKTTLKEILSNATEMYKWLANPLAIAQAEKDIKELWPDGKPAPLPDNTQSKSSPIVSKSDSKIPEVEKSAPESPIDIDWLHENLKKAKFEKACVSWLKSKANYRGLDFTGNIDSIVRQMNKEQADFLVNEIKARIEMV